MDILEILKGLVDVKMGNMIFALFGKVEQHNENHYYYLCDKCRYADAPAQIADSTDGDEPVLTSEATQEVESRE